MLTEKEITNNFDDYKKFKHLYFAAFPKNEREPVKYLLKHDTESSLIACYDRKTFCGFYSTLTFGDITHILFLAIVDELRNHGYGSAVLDLISDRYNSNRIILDIESDIPDAPNYEQRVRRKAFYEKNGYVESGIEYDWRGVSYKILIKNGSISEEELDAFWDNFYDKRRSAVAE